MADSRGTRLLRCTLALAAALTVASCADDEPTLFVTMQTRQVVASGFDDHGNGCMSIGFGDDPSGSSTELSAPTLVPIAGATNGGSGALPDSDGFGVERSIRPEGLRVFVFAGPQALAIKTYTKRFLESGKVDRFEVATPVGTRYQLAHRGARVCETDVDLFAQ
jgi:hypothetical protein